MVDSTYRPLVGQTLQLGDIDFSVSRDLKHKFLIVAPLRAQPTSSLDGTEMHSEVELLQKCPGKNVFALNFSFDASVLPAGVFSEPISVFQDEFGMKGAPLSAPVQTVSGTILRFWIAAEFRPDKRSAADEVELHLTNTGNMKSAPLLFPTLEGTRSVRVGVNECERRLLAPTESCVIELAVSPSHVKDEAFEWPVDVGEHALLTLQFELRRGAPLDVEARNR